MSGQKTFNVSGISTQPSLFDGVTSAIQAYQERKRQEKEAIIKKEQDIQRKIAEIRAKISSNSHKKIVVVQPQFNNVQIDDEMKQALSHDNQIKLQSLKQQLPQIKAEYQGLIDQQLLDSSSFQETIQKTEIALQNNNLIAAQTYLQTLDDARVQVIQQLQEAQNQWREQLEFVEIRLHDLKSHIPGFINQQLQGKIQEISNNILNISDQDIENLHQQISSYELQAEQVQTAANNLVASWEQVGYVAHIAEISDGDVIINIETHEGVNTQMRIQFDGQQIDLAGPHDEEGDASCSSRTFDVIEIFKQQGYDVQWTQWNGQPVDEEWRNVDLGIISVKTTSEYDFNNTSNNTSTRRSESEGF
ncbi:hypothetical protein H6F32_00220 [Anabaena sp. FACHB-1237]|uniref:hypothetical protein n=1 Tax=Anabaena sp. FACHB-1237 TaxID=2692769 RepID=UPI001680B397|nr:hypothetical protein [Anabaena sp. FACHB-1237]MBD2136042.1 hypothetical protein [Anabaena sp. FACHB-1237]